MSAEHVEKIRLILLVLHSADDIKDMDISSFHLHPLRGDLKGFWSTTVRANWRVVFRFEHANAFEVDLTDYH